MMIRAGSDYAFGVGYDGYANGFGNLSAVDYWTGLEKLHQMTSAPGAVYRLRVEVGAASSGLEDMLETLTCGEN